MAIGYWLLACFMTNIPSTTWRTLAHRQKSEELPKGLDAVWDTASGLVQRCKPRAKEYIARAARVLAYENEYKDLSDARLAEAAHAMRDLFRIGRETDEELERAFAVVREVAWRHRGERPYLVQVAGAMALWGGNIAEMATGEGKTLTATMPATIGGWRGRGCHVVTHNDFLAKRDAQWMEPIYRFCGLTVGYIEETMPPAARKEAYQKDITYCTNKSVTADFLRDRLALGRLRGLSSALLAKITDGSGSGTDRLVQRGLYYAIVDEADSLLIDEAVTPLIISGEAPNQEQVTAFSQAASMAIQLDPARDYRVNVRYREVDLTPSGKDKLAGIAENLDGIWKGTRRREELVTQALTAKEFYLNGKQYVVQEDKVVIVDEFTGRLMPDREWRDGLHQAVSAKEQVTIQPPKDTYARMSFQRFFRLYKRLSGMTGTAFEAVREFWQIYHLPVVQIPTNRPCIRQKLPDRVFATDSAKWTAITQEIHEIHKTGRPVLIGTRSVRASELLSDLLVAKGLEHQVLNAVKHAEESQIVAEAGQPGRITVATNMAGRGTDIKLGRGVKDLGGLYVLATERHEAGRIDRQLYGRAGRQGDPGTAQTFVCLKDELILRYMPHLGKVISGRYGHTEQEITSSFTRRLFDITQRRAERLALRQRKGVLKTDDWLDEYLGFAGSEQ